MNTVGLFGTCGKSKWRKVFIERFETENISYYNPQVDDWKEELAIEEAEHLANDQIILFPVTSEEYSLGSLSEVGFSILNAINLDNRRDFIILINQFLDKDLEDLTLRKESLRARALVSQHLKKLNLSNLYIVETLEEMLEVSCMLYRSNELREQADAYIQSRRK